MLISLLVRMFSFLLIDNKWVVIFILVNFSNISCVVFNIQCWKYKNLFVNFSLKMMGVFFFKLWMDKVQTKFNVYWWVLHNQEHYISWWIVLDQIWQIVKNNKGILNSLLPVKSVSKMDHYSKGVIFQRHEGVRWTISLLHF